MSSFTQSPASRPSKMKSESFCRVGHVIRSTPIYWHVYSHWHKDCCSLNFKGIRLWFDRERVEVPAAMAAIATIAAAGLAAVKAESREFLLL
jgi:hypothetical protein